MFTAQWAKGSPRVTPRTWDDTVNVVPIAAAGVAALVLAILSRRRQNR